MQCNSSEAQCTPHYCSIRSDLEAFIHYSSQVNTAIAKKWSYSNSDQNSTREWSSKTVKSQFRPTEERVNSISTVQHLMGHPWWDSFRTLAGFKHSAYPVSTINILAANFIWFPQPTSVLMQNRLAGSSSAHLKVEQHCKTMLKHWQQQLAGKFYFNQSKKPFPLGFKYG